MDELEKALGGIRSRRFLGILYPDSESYDCEAVILFMKQFFDDWAFALHDQDVDADGNPKKPHYHWLGSFKNARSLLSISKACGIPANSIETVKKWKQSVRYLIHLDNPDKFQYHPLIVDASFPTDKFFYDRDASELAGEILERMTAQPFDSITELVAYSITNGLWSELVRAYRIWERVFYEQKPDPYSKEDKAI